MDNFSPNDKCPVCNVEVRHHDENQATTCWDSMSKTKQVEEQVEALKRSGAVSQKFGQHTFEKSDKQYESNNYLSWTKARVWAPFDSVGLYLYGTQGTGKTYAARSVLYQALFYGKSVMEITAYKMLRHEALFKNYVQNTFEMPHFLLIDDIDKAEWNTKSLNYLWSLLNERSNNGNRTIITSNVKPENLRSVIGAGSENNQSTIESAMQRLHPITTLEFKGKSIRGMV